MCAIISDMIYTAARDGVVGTLQGRYFYDADEQWTAALQRRVDRYRRFPCHTI